MGGDHLVRYFRSTVEIYATICAQLDAAYGYPNESTKTDRTLPLASALPTDSSGMVYLAVQQWFCEYILPSEMLPQLLAVGAVSEITAEEYSKVAASQSP